MFCPQCGSQPGDEVRFCKGCGANLQAVRMAVTSPENPDKFDWNKTWVTEMFISQAEKKRRKMELERQMGITPEVTRFREIKAGVIVGSVGIGVAIFLHYFMQGLILSGKIPPDTAEILSVLWVSGVIPLVVGLSLIINGLFVSKKMVEIARRNVEAPGTLDTNSIPPALRSADTTEFVPAGYSVTEDETTRFAKAKVKSEN